MDKKDVMNQRKKLKIVCVGKYKSLKKKKGFYGRSKSISVLA